MRYLLIRVDHLSRIRETLARVDESSPWDDVQQTLLSGMLYEFSRVAEILSIYVSKLVGRPNRN